MDEINVVNNMSASTNLLVYWPTFSSPIPWDKEACGGLDRHSASHHTHSLARRHTGASSTPWHTYGRVSDPLTHTKERERLGTEMESKNSYNLILLSEYQEGKYLSIYILLYLSIHLSEPLIPSFPLTLYLLFRFTFSYFVCLIICIWRFPRSF